MDYSLDNGLMATLMDFKVGMITSQQKSLCFTINLWVCLLCPEKRILLFEIDFILTAGQTWIWIKYYGKPEHLTRLYGVQNLSGFIVVKYAELLSKQENWTKDLHSRSA